MAEEPGWLLPVHADRLTWPFRQLDSAGMDEGKASGIWSVFEEVAPNLCYIARTRELLSDLVCGAEGLDELLDGLRDAMAETDNASLRTDLKILEERLQRRRKSILPDG